MKNRRPVRDDKREEGSEDDGRTRCPVGLMRRYLAAVMDPSVSLLEIHKLMYFMQEAGEPLKLNYSKGPYGPYAENLRHVLGAIEGHFISGYGDAEDNAGIQIELKLEAAELLNVAW